MSTKSFIKATVICSLLSFLVYTFPVLGQVAVIGLLGVLWSACALQTAERARKKRFA